MIRERQHDNELLGNPNDVEEEIKQDEYIEINDDFGEEKEETLLQHFLFKQFGQSKKSSVHKSNGSFPTIKGSVNTDTVGRSDH